MITVIFIIKHPRYGIIILAAFFCYFVRLVVFLDAIVKNNSSWNVDFLLIFITYACVYSKPL